MRSYVIAGNWKMNKTWDEANSYFDGLVDWINENATDLTELSVIVCPPALYLEMGSDYAESADLFMGGQDVSARESGAYTGEISAAMLHSLSVSFCIVGHSERRKYHGETDEIVNAKLGMLLKQGLVPIFCIGETQQEREEGKTREVLERQLTEGLKGLKVCEEMPICIAYEPVWAIGTGKTATPEMAQEEHAFIREWLVSHFSEEDANATALLYGGSVTPDNIEALLLQDDIDGALIGGASLNVNSFIEMIKTAIKLSKD